jgi:Cytochrome P460
MIAIGIGDVSEQKARSNKYQNNVHQTIFGAVYLNDIALATLPESRPLNYPEGAVIVREKLKTELSAPEVLTAMIKRKKGFNPEANDWEFLLISGDATKIKNREKTGACLGCHESVSDKDFVFDNYLPPRGPEATRFGVPDLLSKQPNPLLRF